MKTTTIGVIAADRGDFVRAAPLLAELRARPGCQARFVFAGEDYVPWAASELFRDLGLPFADVMVGASEGSPAARLSRVLANCEHLATSGEYDALVLVGQSHAMLACVIAAARSEAIVAHVEAGLRAPGLPGRTSLAAQIDRGATLLYAASERAYDRLLDEGTVEDRVTLAGTLAGDAVAACLERARGCSAPARAGMTPKRFALVVAESPQIIAQVSGLHRLVALLGRVQDQLPVALCVHRRLAQRLEAWQLAKGLAELSHVVNIEPHGYVDFLSWLDSAQVVLTDIGGVQDEATLLQVPCVTLADVTDRAETVECGNNDVVGLDADLAAQAVAGVVENEYPAGVLPAAWDGQAGVRIADGLLRAVEEKA